MSHYTRINLKQDVKDSYSTIAPDFRAPFGHTHSEQEEVYVLISGNAVLKVEDDEVELGTLDAVRIAPGAMRALQGGPDGCELIAFGAPNTENKDAEVQPGWWT